MSAERGVGARVLRWGAWCVAVILSAAAGTVAWARGVEGKDPSFRNDVLPILSKAGCNGGGCHGKAAGQNGLTLPG